MAVIRKHFLANQLKQRENKVIAGFSLLAITVAIGLSLLSGPVGVAQAGSDATQAVAAQQKQLDTTDEPSTENADAVPRSNDVRPADSAESDATAMPSGRLPAEDDVPETELEAVDPVYSYTSFDPLARGQDEFRQNCVACHGEEGRGDGSIAHMLTKAPPNLQLIAERAGGQFPMELVYKIIDGREQLLAHGSRDMPVWGNRFNAEAALELEPNADDALLELIAASRTMSLVFYLGSIQSVAPDSDQ